MQGKQVRVSWVALLLLWSLASADAACPQDICECLGQAATFSLVAADTATIQAGRVGQLGYRYQTSARVGSVCTPRARLSGTGYAQTEVGDLMLVAGPGTIAGRFRTLRGDGDFGVVTTDDIATGGGRIVGDFAHEAPIDTTGTHPRISSCIQAILDIEDASATLAALPPTMDLGKLTVTGDELEISVGPGVQVINATQISLRPASYDGYRGGATLTIERDSDTEVVIVNTARLHVGYKGTLWGADIVNLPGRGALVAIGTDADVPLILAPKRRVAAKGSGDNGIINGLLA